MAKKPKVKKDMAKKPKLKKDLKEKKKNLKLLTDYHDPTKPGSLGSVARFAKAQKIPLGKARKLLERDLGYTLHKPRRKRFTTTPVLVFNMDQQWVADLVEVQSLSKDNKGNRYLLNVIDVLSKYAWVEPVKNKTGEAVTDAFKKILKRAKGRTPQNLQTDDGKEFYNKTFADLMKRKKINHFSTAGDTKASIVERFNRTLYINVLPDLVKGYNASFHRSIGMAPKKVTIQNEHKVWNRLYAHRFQSKKTQKKNSLKSG